jgi:UDP-2,4-diacetamido-2,4,6-trideoxy-beta-L-altropyranose hydrolase
MIAAGWSVGFASSAETLALVPRLGDRVEVLEARDNPSLDLGALAERWPFGCDILIVDQYSLGTAFETRCRGWANRIVVIDDLANRSHDCDLLIDTTFGRMAADYFPLVPARALVLVGAQYAPLRPEFAARRAESLGRRAAFGKVERILVSLGLTDVGGITEQVVRVMRDVPPNVWIDVVIGAAAPSRSGLEELAAKEPRLCLHIDPLDMAGLMVKADLAIGAGGTTGWERCCLGLPTLMLVLADNQEMNAKELERAGAAVRVGYQAKINPRMIGKALITLIAEPNRLRGMSEQAAAICDGRGVERVYKNILSVNARDA